MKRTHIYLPAELHADLVLRAEQDGHTMSRVVRMALSYWFHVTDDPDADIAAAGPGEVPPEFARYMRSNLRMSQVERNVGADEFKGQP